MNNSLKDMEERFGQISALVWVFMNKLSILNLSSAQIQELMKNKDHPFWLAFDEATKLLAPGSTEWQVNFWVSLYKTHFNIDLNPADVKIPDRRDGFNWLVIVAQGVSLNQVWTVCKQHFKCWNYADSTDDLEGLLQESERGPVQTTSLFWFRDRPEADEETQDLSANQQTEPSITLIARCLLELKYFSETGKHLDVTNSTLCAGSLCACGLVPGARWYGDGTFSVFNGEIQDHHHRLRSRVAVGG